MKKGVENMRKTQRAIVKLAAAEPKMLEAQGKPALDGAVDALSSNVQWGNDTVEGTVEPEEIKHSFADSAQFNAEIATTFPDSYNIVHKLRQDLKLHHFELSNTIKDVELLA